MQDITLDIFGMRIDVELIAQRSGGRRVMDVEHEDGRKWRMVVMPNGEDYYTETMLRDDQLADLDEPDWLSEVLARLKQTV